MAQKSTRNTGLPAQTHFGDLVHNAVDFMARSITELQSGDVKFSAMHFYQGIELFVKARLLLEHWSLVVTEPAKADLAKFERGDFHSVSMSQAIERLRNIVGDDITGAERTFEPVRRRRNRASHFHAPEYRKITIPVPRQLSQSGLDALIGAVPEVSELVVEQCVAWFELHSLLAGKWKSHFAGFAGRIDQLDRDMLVVRPYLKTRFESLKAEIDKLAAAGGISGCPVCGFAAYQEAPLFPGMFYSQCLVCRRNGRLFRLPCPQPNCHGSVPVEHYSGGICQVCDEEMSIEEILSHFEPIRRPGDSEPSTRARCSECECIDAIVGSVIWVPTANRYVCFTCLADHDRVSSCNRCGGLVTGDASESAWLGCLECKWTNTPEEDD